MASLFDQYEQASAGRSRSRPTTVMPEPIGTTGIINARLEDETPIFNKQRINFKPPDPITHLQVCNNNLAMAMSSNMLLRLDLEHPDQPDEVEITKNSMDRVHKIFLDPTGQHLLINMESQETYFLYKNSKKPKVLGKLKGHFIESVGWNRQNTSDRTTGAILLGTSKGIKNERNSHLFKLIEFIRRCLKKDGAIFETEISSGEDSNIKFFQGSLEQYWKQVFTIDTDGKTAVTGIEFEKLPSSSLTEYTYFILVTTPGRLYQFLGNITASSEAPMFSSVFQAYEDNPEQFLELPGNFGYSELKLYHPKFRGIPSSFAWMTGPGVYFGGLDETKKNVYDSVTKDTKLMQYPRDEGERETPPLAMVLTEFHCLVLFQNRLRAMCVLNEQLVYEDVYSEKFGRLLGLCQDPLKGIIWTYTDQCVFKYKIVKESRDVWQMYLDKGQFDLALAYAKDSLVNKNKVFTKQADYYFANGQYEESARLFASTQNSFEEIALKFIKVEKKDALKIFLHKKLDSLRSQDQTQMTMIITWLIEIYLNELGKLKEQGQRMNDSYDILQKEFREFLNQSRTKECVNYSRSTVYDLIASHGNIEDMIFFAMIMKDFERVISHHIQHDSYKQALHILTKQSDTELVYKFSPLLMQNVAKETVDMWIQMRNSLDPKKLIPALVQFDQDRSKGNEAIRYLEYCIQYLDNRDEAIHNYLLSLYAKLQPERLMTYLELQGIDAEEVCYDLKYALRLCSETGHQRACVHIYSTMGLYEEAVELALKVDVDLAKLNADKPDDDEDLRKKLWLRIARHVVEEQKDIKRAMEFLHECDLLKIEDILPFFPDFVTIDHFKDAICQSLEEYNQHIESLKVEMDDATQSAQEIRDEIQAFRNKFAFVKNDDKCSACSFPLLTRGFYLFPCNHRFHSDCLVSEVVPHLSKTKQQHVEDLQRRMTARDDHGIAAMASLTMGLAKSRNDAQAKDQLDSIVANECVYCGEAMIRCIDKPFIEEDEYEEVMNSWE